MILSRREYDRFAVDTHAALKTADNDSARGVRVYNICARGLAGTLNYPLETGAGVTLTLYEPFFASPVQRHAEVVWCRESDPGCWMAGFDFGSGNLVDLREYSAAYRAWSKGSHS